MAKTEREFSSGGVVIKLRGSEIRILLIKDPYGKWTWPKGKIDKGETSLEAAKREVAEEAGLKNIELISKIQEVKYFYRRQDRLIYKTVYFYLFKFNGRERVSPQTSEIDDCRWFSEKEALARVGYKGAREVLEKAIKAFKQRFAVRGSRFAVRG